MSVIILPHPWKRQPPQDTHQLDTENPLLRNYSAVWSGGRFYKPFTPTNQLYTTIPGTNAGVLNSSFGGLNSYTARAGAGSLGGITIGTQRQILGDTADRGTFALVFRHTDTTLHASNAFGAGNIAEQGFAVSCYMPFSDGNVYFDFGGNATGRISAAWGGKTTTGLQICICVAGPRKGREIWRNGRKLIANTATTTTLTLTDIVPWYIGNHLDAVGVDAIESYAFVSVAREWSDSECFAFSENPWQIFRPLRRRIYVGVISGDVSASLTEVSAAGSVNSLTVDATANASETLAGVSAAGAVNSITVELTESEMLSGLTAAGAVGDLSAEVTFDASATLTELSATGAVGDLSVEIVGDALTVDLTGISAAAAVGTLSATSDTADSVSIAGVAAASAVGDLQASASDVLAETLSSVNASAGVSDLTATIIDADALTPVSAQAEVGSLTADITADVSAALTEVSASAAVTDLQIDLSLQFEIELTGVSATGIVRDLRVPEDQPQIDEAIRDALKHLVKGNIYPLRRPQRETQQQANAYLPEIVYTIVSDDWQQAETICGVGLHNIRVQIDIYAQHYREARAFAYAAAAEMDNLGWRINMQPFPDDDEKIYRWQLEYSCWRNEAPPGLPLTRTHRG